MTASFSTLHPPSTSFQLKTNLRKPDMSLNKSYKVAPSWIASRQHSQHLLSIQGTPKVILYNHCDAFPPARQTQEVVAASAAVASSLEWSSFPHYPDPEASTLIFSFYLQGN
jgi:hypothetical protein